jgi:hypothetical protein
MDEPKVQPPMIDMDVDGDDDTDEAAWESEIVRQALGDALLPNGDIDANILRAMTIPIALEELYPEGEEDEEA